MEGIEIPILLPLLLCVPALAAQPSRWTQHTNGDDVLSLAVGGGVAWAGTAGGLVRLDPASGEARFFNTSNSALPDNLVFRIQVDGQGRAWVLTRFGTLLRYEGAAFAPIAEQVLDFLVLGDGTVAACRQGSVQIFDGAWRTVDTLRSGENHCGLAQGPGSEVWVSQSRDPDGFGGRPEAMFLARYDTRTRTPTLRLGPEQPGLRDMVPLTGLLPEADGTLWAASGGRLLHFGDSLLGQSSGPDGEVAAMLRDADGTLWAGSDRGLARRDDGEWTVFETAMGQLPSDRVRALARDGNRLLVGTDSGLVEFTPDGWRKLRTSAAALPSNAIRSLHAAPGGDLWIGTERGIVRRRDTAWTLVRDGSASRTPEAIVQFLSARDGSLWMATRGDEILRLRDGAWSRFPFPDGVVPGNLASRSMAEDGMGRIWVALGDHMARFDGTHWTVFALQDLDLDCDWLRYLVSDGSGALWAAGDGLARFDGFAWTLADTQSVGDIAWEPLRGRLFGSLSMGLAEFEDGIWRRLPVARPAQPAEYGFGALTPDGRGNLWLTYADTGFRGLAWSAGDSLRFSPDLPPSDPNCMAFDAAGRLWAGSEAGLAVRDGAGTPAGPGFPRRAVPRATRAGRILPGERAGTGARDVAGRSLARPRDGSRAETVYLVPLPSRD